MDFVDNLPLIIPGLLAILIGISVHEMMHAFVSDYLGDDTARHQGRITINPLAHIDLFTTILLPLGLILAGLPPLAAAKPVPFQPSRLKWGEYGAALMAFAGPASNLGLAIIGSIGYQLSTAEVLVDGFAIFTAVNVGLFIFNMIPFPPLDGSRVLYAFAPDPVREIMNRIEAGGLVYFGVFFIFGYRFLQPLLIWANNLVLGLLF